MPSKYSGVLVIAVMLSVNPMVYPQQAADNSPDYSSDTTPVQGRGRFMSLEDYLARFDAPPSAGRGGAVNPRSSSHSPAESDSGGETQPRVSDSEPKKGSREKPAALRERPANVLSVREYLEITGQNRPQPPVAEADVSGTRPEMPPKPRVNRERGKAGPAPLIIYDRSRGSFLTQQQQPSRGVELADETDVEPPATAPPVTGGSFAESATTLAGERETSEVTATEQPPRPLPVQGPFPVIEGDREKIGIKLAADSLDGEIDISSAVRRAIGTHPSIAQAMGRLNRQQEFVSVAKAGYFPQVSGGLSTGYRESTGDTEESFTASASQMLYDFGKTSNSVDAEKYGVQRDRAAVHLAMEELARETANAFIEVQRHQALLKIAREQIKAIGDLEELTSKRAAMGASTLSDEVQAKSRKEGAKATELQIQAQLDVWKRALQNLMGARYPHGVVDRFPNGLENACQRVPDNLDDAPQIVMADAQRDEASAIIEQARSEFFPTLSLNADYENFFNRTDTALSLAQEDEELVFSLNVTSNLFQGGAVSARSRAAGHALNTATAARDQAHLRLNRSLNESRDQARSLKKSLAVQDARHENIVKTQELYRHQYLSLGTRTLLDILNTEQEIHQTRFDTQNTRFDLRRLQIECLFNVGALRETFNLGTGVAWTDGIQP